jgi:hypothetical protein
VSIDSEEVHELWRALRDAAGAMSLWGQVAAAELRSAEIAGRIVSASERLITAIEQIEDAAGLSDGGREAIHPTVPGDGPVAMAAAIDGRPCLLGSLLGASSDADQCPAWGGVEGRAALYARLRDVLDEPVIDIAVPRSGRLVCGRLTLDVDAHRVWIAGEPVSLPTRQFLVLVVLMANAGRVIRPGDLARAAWQVSASPKQVADAIHLLRKRLAAAGAPNAIRTMTPAGYRLVDPDPPEGAAGSAVAPGT